MGKAKPAHHTSRELAAKAKAATENKGGGKAGLQDRKGGATGHSRFKCPICMSTAPDMKTMEVRSPCMLLHNRSHMSSQFRAATALYMLDSPAHVVCFPADSL